MPVWRCEYYHGYCGPKHTRELVYTCESSPLVSTLDLVYVGVSINLGT